MYCFFWGSVYITEIHIEINTEFFLHLMRLQSYLIPTTLCIVAEFHLYGAHCLS